MGEFDTKLNAFRDHFRSLSSARRNEVLEMLQKEHVSIDSGKSNGSLFGNGGANGKSSLFGNGPSTAANGGIFAPTAEGSSLFKNFDANPFLAKAKPLLDDTDEDLVAKEPVQSSGGSAGVNIFGGVFNTVEDQTEVKGPQFEGLPSLFKNEEAKPFGGVIGNAAPSVFGAGPIFGAQRTAEVKIDPAVMVNDDSFWNDEKDSALMTRNDCLFKDKYDELIKRVRTWFAYIPQDLQDVDADAGLKVNDPEALRIFEKDAVRTVDVVSRRARYVECLKLVWTRVGDYHQGEGYCIAFLSLFLPRQDVARIIWHMNFDMVPDYFRGQPDGFVADAYAFGKLLSVRSPTLAAHLLQNHIMIQSTHMYCVKWFVGLGVHFAPFSIVLQMMETFLDKGSEFLFQFGFAWMEHWESLLMTQSGTKDINCMLRNEHPTDAKKRHPTLFKTLEEEISVFESIIAKALKIDLNAFGIDFVKFREQERSEFLLDLQKTREKIKQRAEEYSDDEIVFSDEED